MTDLPLHWLPPKLREVAEYCGESTARVLLTHFGGGHLFVPRIMPNEHRLAELLGLESASKLCRMYGGEVLQVPRAAQGLRRYRNVLIQKEYADGATQFDLARRYGLTERQVNKILGAVADNNAAQKDLFGP